MTEEENSLPTPVVELYPEDKIQLEWQQRTKIGAGLVNLGNTCFINSVLQILTYTAPFANICLNGDHIAKLNEILVEYSRQYLTCSEISSLIQKQEGKQTGFCMLCEMQKHIKLCFKNSGTAIRPNNIVKNLGVIADHMRWGRQEDAHEFLVYVLDAMKPSAAFGIKGLDQFSMETALVGRIFSGFLNSQVKCLNCNRRSCRYEAFNGISLDIKNMKTLVQAFKTYVAPETLSGDNAYMCTTCNKKVPAQKGCAIEKPPAILTVSLQRFDCFTGRKLCHHVQFEEELNIQPFLSSAQGDKMPYRLYAVIVHSGTSSSSGHYYAFVKSPLGQWHSMNDAKVKPVPVSKVLSAQAYLLFYERCKTSSIPKDTTSDTVSGLDNRALNDAEEERQRQDEKWAMEQKSLKKDFDNKMKNKDKTIREKDKEIQQLTAKNTTQMQQLEKSRKELQLQLEEKDRMHSELKEQVERMAAQLKASKQARKHQAHQFTSRLEQEKAQLEEKQNERLKELEKEHQEKDEKASETITELQSTILKLQEENKRIKDEGDRKLQEHVTRLEEEKEEMKKQLNLAVENQIHAEKTASKSFKSSIAKFFKKFTGRKSSIKTALSPEQRYTPERNSTEAVASEQTGIAAEVAQAKHAKEDRGESTTGTKGLKLKQLLCCCGS